MNNIPYNRKPLYKRLYLRLKYQPYYVFMSFYYVFFWALEGFPVRKINETYSLTRCETCQGFFRRNHSRMWYKMDDYQYSDAEIQQFLLEDKKHFNLKDFIFGEKI